MALREFEDEDGVIWRVWDTNPDILRGLSQAMQSGWLTFDNGLERRRLSPIPAHWTELPTERLALLVQLAAPVLDQRSKTPTPPQLERRARERRIADRRSGERRRTGETEQRRGPHA